MRGGLVREQGLDVVGKVWEARSPNLQVVSAPTYEVRPGGCDQCPGAEADSKWHAAWTEPEG